MFIYAFRYFIAYNEIFIFQARLISPSIVAICTVYKSTTYRSHEHCKHWLSIIYYWTFQCFKVFICWRCKPVEWLFANHTISALTPWCPFLLTKAKYLYQLSLTTNSISHNWPLSIYTVTMLILDLLILFSNGLHQGCATDILRATTRPAKVFVWLSPTHEWLRFII